IPFLSSSSSCIPPPPTSTLFPYTTLFRSQGRGSRHPVNFGVRRHDCALGAAARRGGAILTRKTPRRAEALRPKRCHALCVTHKRSEEHTSELQSLTNLVCRLLLEKKKTIN